MAEHHVVEHFPIVPGSASIVDISTGKVFGDVERAQGWLGRINPFVSERRFHWSSSIEGKPTWAIVNGRTKVLHIRAHDCPCPATPLHPTCFNCITEELTDDVEFVFTWKTTRAEVVTPTRNADSVPNDRPSDIDHEVATADTPICELFEDVGPWHDVYRRSKYDFGPRTNLALQHCGACPNPMDPRLDACATCVSSRAPTDFPGADYILFVKMLRPEDGLEQRASFSDLNDAIAGRSAPPRFGSSSVGSNQEFDDTSKTRVYTG